MMERDSIGCVHWTSQRFETEDIEYPTNFVFYPDGKAKPVSHNGMHGFIVGEVKPLDITYEDPKQVLVYFEEEHSVAAMSPSRVIYERK